MMESKVSNLELNVEVLIENNYDKQYLEDISKDINELLLIVNNSDLEERLKNLRDKITFEMNV